MFEGKTVLITGGTGSLGRKLVSRLEEHKPKKVIVYSRDEFKQSEMARDFAGRDDLRFFLGDVRDAGRLTRVCRNVDYVIHAAALKQVPALEYNPTEAIRTNVEGTRNVVEACMDAGVEKAVLISTDKAVNPVNLYGATKLVAEKTFLAANAFNRTRFNVVRYGNVIGSRGSFIELLYKLRNDGVTEVPVTDTAMTRFWLSLDEAATLVFVALEYANPVVFVPKIPTMLVTDVARAIIPDCTFKEIGIRPGEKVHETLISADDNKNCIVVCRSENGTGIFLAHINELHSHTARSMSIETFRKLIEKENGNDICNC